MATLFDSGVTYSTGRPAVMYYESTGPRTGETAPTWSDGRGYTTVSATSVRIELPADLDVLAIRKSIARHPRSGSGRLCTVAPGGRVGVAPCWNRQKSTPPARTFEAASTYKARTMAELKRVRAKRN